MRDTTVRPEHGSNHANNHITRKNLISSLLIGVGLGIFAGAPLGWFAHKIYGQQRAAQVLLCRQQNYGLAEPQLQSRCGSVY